MKITNWRKRLTAALVAGGVLIPTAAGAANLGTNLVVNPGFENVDLGTTSFYNAPKILDWVSAVPGFAYSHDLSGAAVPDYANGGPLASGGHWYFTPGNGGNQSFADGLKQSIDVSTGPTAALIASGGASYNLSAFFNSYANQVDRGFVRADFLSSSASILGIAQVASPGNPALQEWTAFSATGPIPVGTVTVALTAWGEIGQPGSADGYTDNVYFAIVPEPTSFMLAALGAGRLAIRRRRETS